MKKRIKQVSAFIATLIFSCLIAVPVFGLTESEVQTQVDANGTGAVTGNLCIWFLCAVAFLKVSQKIDSFMSSLGINVGHTGGSMLAEAMIAMRGVVTAKQFTNGFGHYSKGSTGSDGGSFMSGGLSGIVSRGVTNNAVKNVTGNSDNGLGGKIYPDKSPDEILSIFAEIKELSPGYMVYVLKTFNDKGICNFLENNRCTIYKYRPRTCRTYPFAIEPVSNENILKWIVCTEQSHHFNGGYITPREWQRKMLTKEDIDFLKTEIDIIPQIGKLIHQIPNSLIEKAAQLSLAFTYFAYDFSLPFLPQYKENMLMLMNLLKQMQSGIQKYVKK